MLGRTFAALKISLYISGLAKGLIRVPSPSIYIWTQKALFTYLLLVFKIFKRQTTLFKAHLRNVNLHQVPDTCLVVNGTVQMSTKQTLKTCSVSGDPRANCE